ncbi:MAG: succinate--CoA ligase subunit beta, partial [Sphingomonadales bacterium]|nr:succinate--CoA ligase subunit beta [Sphingomonadales bacterium]
MNIHEYQGKALLSQYGVTVQRGILASTPDEAVQAANALKEQTGTSWWVVKAQVHAGGRGKGGGIKLAKSLEQVQDLSSQILGMQLVTPQTGSAGKKVHSVL